MPVTDVVVVVPVLGRPHHARTFLESFHANTPEGKAVVLPVLSEDDPVSEDVWEQTHAAWMARGYPPALAPSHTFAAKVNHAYDNVKLWRPEASWLLLVGSDVIFKPRWLESALITAQLSGAKLIATNDLGNARVMAGDHATHPLINRQWVDSHGASWDGPGTLAHSGYQHCFVDDEWTTVAKQAGVFAYSSLAIIEHNHPVWRKAVNDDVYDLGQASFEVDKALFLERAVKNGCTLA